MTGVQQDDVLRAQLEEWARALEAARRRSSFRFAPGEALSRRAVVNRHVQRQTDALLRSLSLQTALDQADTQAAASRQSLERFQEALEPPPSRWFIVVILVLITLIAQLVITVMANSGFTSNVLERDLISRSASGDPASILRLAGKLFTGKSLDRVLLLGSLSFAGYLVLRGPARGFEQAQRLISVSEAGARFEALGLARDPEFPFDLAVKALLAIGLLSWGTFAWVYQTSLGFQFEIGPEIYWQGAIGLLGFVRLAWIGFKWSRVGYGLTPFFVASGLVAIVLVFAEISASQEESPLF